MSCPTSIEYTFLFMSGDVSFEPTDQFDFGDPKTTSRNSMANYFGRASFT